MTQSNELAFARPHSKVVDHGIPEEFSQQEGLTKREYFAAHADVPWNAVIETLMIKHPEKKGKISMDDVFEYQAAAKVRAADFLIEQLNKQP